jgi:UDP-2,3-diacylglucosamine hydrolase
LPSDLQLIKAPPEWRVVDFISDLHLQAAEPLTFAAWQKYLENTRAGAVFMLGDLFEVWVGDDAAAEGTQDSTSKTALGHPSFEAVCASVLKQASERFPLYFMHGNRDFLVGKKFCDSTGVTLLADPCIFEFRGERWVLSHGDALCLADVDYQAFRKTVRSPAWQAGFLAKPLNERRDIARGLRQQSEARKSAVAAYADADEDATLQLLAHTGARHLVHGHTHRPATHVLPGGLQRHVLSDWDLTAVPARAQVFRLSREEPGTASIGRIPLEQA